MRDRVRPRTRLRLRVRLPLWAPERRPCRRTRPPPHRTWREGLRRPRKRRSRPTHHPRVRARPAGAAARGLAGAHPPEARAPETTGPVGRACRGRPADRGFGCETCSLGRNAEQGPHDGERHVTGHGRHLPGHRGHGDQQQHDDRVGVARADAAAHPGRVGARAGRRVVVRHRRPARRAGALRPEHRQGAGHTAPGRPPRRDGPGGERAVGRRDGQQRRGRRWIRRRWAWSAA